MAQDAQQPAHARSGPKTKFKTLKFTPDQLRMIDQKAKRCGVKLATYMRSVILQAASKQASDGYLRIKEPVGETT